MAAGRSAFAPSGAQARERIDVDRVIGDALAIINEELQLHRIEMHLELGASAATVVADRGHVQQVILNLAANAIDAMAQQPGGAKELAIVSKATKSGGVVVSVADTGPGVDPDLADHISMRSLPPSPTAPAWVSRFADRWPEPRRSLVLSREHAPGAAFCVELPGAPDGTP